MAEPKILTLAYRRSRGDLSTGAFLLTTAETDTANVLEHFEDLTFIDMMKKFAKYLADYPQVSAAFQRTDRPGLLPFLLAPDEIELFRSDPAAAIRQRMISPQVVHIPVDKSRKPSANSAIPPLDAGYATLAQCFGELVYTRVRKRPEDLPLVECTSCGFWCPIARIDADGWAFRCVECSAWVPVADFQPDEGWAGVSIDTLLASGTTRFFLPRKWNKNGNWISRPELVEMYDTFKKEKSRCSS